MKKLFVITVLALLLAACEQASQLTQNTYDRQRSAAQPTQSYSTSTPIPTETIGWQQTAVNAQSTSDAAMRLMVEATSAEAQRQQERLLMTATIDIATIQAGQLTAQSDIATSTAALTAVPLTSTAQSLDREIAKTQISDSHTAVAMTRQAPTQVILMAYAQSQAKYADVTMRVDIGVRIAVSFFVIVLSALMVYVILRRNTRSEQPTVFIRPLDDIPLRKHEEQGSVRFTRADVPCTKDQLLELADGIINRGMTLSFNPWEGTTVHKVLKVMREFMVENHFARNVKGQGGLLDILADGEKFLRDTLDKQEPPAPFRCLPDNA